MKRQNLISSVNCFAHFSQKEDTTKLKGEGGVTEHLVLAIYQDYKYILIPLNIRKTQNTSGFKKFHLSKQRWHSGNFSFPYNYENENWTMQDKIGKTRNVKEYDQDW